MFIASLFDQHIQLCGMREGLFSILSLVDFRMLVTMYGCLEVEYEIFTCPKKKESLANN